MKLTKKSAVNLSDNTLIAYLLSSLCNYTVCKCQELALNKAPVLLTTPNSLCWVRVASSTWNVLWPWNTNKRRL